MQRIGRSTVLRSRHALAKGSALGGGRVSALSTKSASSVFAPTDTFKERHMGSQGADKQAMLDKVSQT
jgi:hypothetical protein